MRSYQVPLLKIHVLTLRRPDLDLLECTLHQSPQVCWPIAFLVWHKSVTLFLFINFPLTGELNIDDLCTVQTATWSAFSQWYNIGLQLGLSAATLDALRRNHRDICEDCYTQVLATWLRGDCPRPTWSALAEALRAPTVGMGHLAEQLPRKC